MSSSAVGFIRLLTTLEFTDGWEHAIVPAIDRRIESAKEALVTAATWERVVELQQQIKALRDLRKLPATLTAAAARPEEE